MSTKDDSFTVVPLNMLPSELKEDSTPEDVEKERQKIRDRILTKSNEEIVKADSTRPDDDKTMALLRALGSDLNINAFSINWRYRDGTLNDEVEEANYFVQRVIERLSIDSPEDDPTSIPFFLTSTTFLLHEYGQCAQNFKKRLGLVQDQSDLMCLRNVVMSPWATDRDFISSLANEFKKVMVEEVEFIVKVDIGSDGLKSYQDAKSRNPSATFILTTRAKENLGDLATKKKTFKADIEIQNSSKKIIETIKDISVTITSVLKDRSLKARYFDTAYPSGKMPFYLYGSQEELNIDHILVRSPNIQLSANIKLESGTTVSEQVLAKGAILLAEGIEEAAMQPFPATEDNSLAHEPDFFFRPGQKFPVQIFEDKKAADATGPGLADMAHTEVLASGTMTLGQDVYVDAYALNEDPFERVEGDEKFKKWKRVFDRIEQQLQ
ncbi:MAG: hypothetical protein Q9191_001298 [Dirinaria sp. TL-2023a]